MTKLNLPIVIRVATNGEEMEYKLTKGSHEGMVTYIYETNMYENHATEDFVKRLIEDGTYRVVSAGTQEKSDPLSFKINIDSSSVTSALAEAKELEATLLRIKELMA